MNLAQQLPIAKRLELSTGARNDNPKEWAAFGWNEPVHGPQVKGDLIVIRSEGSSGSLNAGLWRTSPLSAGCNRIDGSCAPITYSAPLGDETVLVLEGEATITVTKTGQRYHIKAGDIMSHCKGLDVTWEIPGPFFKKFWVIWDSPQVANPVEYLYIGSVTGQRDGWVPFEWNEPLHGPSRSIGSINAVYFEMELRNGD